MKKTFALLVLFGLALGLSAEPAVTYFYLVSSSFGPIIDGYPILGPEESASSDSDGNYTFVEYSVDFYGTKRVRKLLVNSDKTIIYTSEYYVDGKSIMRNVGGILSNTTYYIALEGDYLILTADTFAPQVEGFMQSAEMVERYKIYRGND